MISEKKIETVVDLDQPIRLPFSDSISDRYFIRSCKPDVECGNGIHHFHVEAVNDVGDVDYVTLIDFQKGSLNGPEAVHNGLLSTVLLQVLITHLDSYTKGDLATEYTVEAVKHLREAYFWLAARTDDRNSRGVLGSYKR